MDWIEPKRLVSANGDSRPQLRGLVRDVHECLAQFNDAAPEQLIVGIWGPQDGLSVVALGGEMDMNNAAQLGRALSGRDDLTRGRVVVELSALTFIDSKGIKELVDVAKFTKAAGGTIVFAAPTPHVVRVLELVQLGKVVTIVASLEAAIDHATDSSGIKDMSMPACACGGQSAEAAGVSNEPL